MSTIAAKKNETQVPMMGWIVLIVIGLGGIGIAWGMQLVQGMGVTGLGQQVVWGLYISGFFTALGAGAALVALTTINEYSGFAPIAIRRNALLLALINFVIGGLLIAMDVGNPVNLWRILSAGRFSSMMTWDFWALIVTGILSLVFLVLSWRQTTSTPITRISGILASISALVLVVVEGWMLASMVAHPLWSGGLTAVSFLVAAFVAGLTIAMFALPDLSSIFGRWLATGLWITLAMVIIEVLTVVVGADVRPRPEVSQLLTGALSPMFWIYILGGVLLPLAILHWQRNRTWLLAAAALALLGVIVEKLWLLVAGQALPWLALTEGSYSPTWVELLGLAGCIAFGVFLYRLLILLFKEK
jgi:molybdopterin-containing oxidoreductase family membrane subunit